MRVDENYRPAKRKTADEGSARKTDGRRIKEQVEERKEHTYKGSAGNVDYTTTQKKDRHGISDVWEARCIPKERDTKRRE